MPVVLAHNAYGKSRVRLTKVPAPRRPARPDRMVGRRPARRRLRGRLHRRRQPPGRRHRHDEEHRLRPGRATTARPARRRSPSSSAGTSSIRTRRSSRRRCPSASSRGSGSRSAAGRTRTPSSAAGRSGGPAPPRPTGHGKTHRGRHRRLDAGLKTADSAFRDFHRDAYTTLPDADDRIFATEPDGRWRYADARPIGTRAMPRSGPALLETFAGHQSWGYSTRCTRWARRHWRRCRRSRRSR